MKQLSANPLSLPGRLSLVAGLAIAPVTSSYAILDFLKRDTIRPSDSEVATIDGEASAMLAEAQSQEASGNVDRALKIYKDIVDDYPRSQSAAESQFKIGELFQMDNSARKQRKAFEAYQKLLTDYKGSPRFADAVQRQFNIAENFRNNGEGGFLGGIGADIQPSKLIEFYQQIAANAPRTELAAQATLAMGSIQSNQNQIAASILSYESVVEGYPETSYAAEAQYQLVELHGREADRSFSPVDLRQQREAGEDFINQFGDNDPRAMEVRQQLGALSDKESEQAFTIGKFYEKSGAPKSAVIYYREVARHPNTKHYEEANRRMAKLVEANPSLAEVASTERTRVSSDTGGSSPILNPNRPVAMPDTTLPANGSAAESPANPAPPAEGTATAAPPAPAPEEKSRPWNILKKPKMRASEDDVLPIPTADPVAGS